MMKWLKDRKQRLTVSLLAGVAAAVLLGGLPAQTGKNQVLAWWGTMYPKFCFAQMEEENEQARLQAEARNGGEAGEHREIKISFWLAKALDW